MNEPDKGLDIAAQVAKDVYHDVAHPAAMRVGDALDSIAKIALSPVALLDWSYEQCKGWLKSRIQARLQLIPAECIEAPSLSIAIPVITSVATTDDPDLREIYAELLLKSIDTRVRGSIHPAYVYVVQQLAPEEARVLLSLRHKGPDICTEKVSIYRLRTDDEERTIEEQFVSQCRSIGIAAPDRAPIWLDNLIRLRVLSLAIYTDPEYVPEEWNRDGVQGPSIKANESRHLSFTEFGMAFVDACSPQLVSSTSPDQ